MLARSTVLSLALCAASLATPGTLTAEVIQLPDYERDTSLTATFRCDKGLTALSRYASERYTADVITDKAGDTFYAFGGGKRGEFYMKRSTGYFERITHSQIFFEALYPRAENARQLLRGGTPGDGNDCVKN